MGSYDVSSSDSDPEQNSTPGEDECGPVDMATSSAGDESLLDYYGHAADITSPRLTLTGSGRPSLTRTSSRPIAIHFSFPGPPALPDVFHTPFRDPLESYFPDGVLDDSTDLTVRPDVHSSKIKPKLATGDTLATPARKLSANAFRAGNTPPARRLKIRQPVSASTTTISSSQPGSEIIEEPPTPSFVVNLAWPRPPQRQIYLDAQNPGASWHAVSREADERLFDGSGGVQVEPCHIIMLAQAMDALALPQAHPDMCDRQPLSPSATSALSAFALQSSPLVSA
jgi:hypothetical protein